MDNQEYEQKKQECWEDFCRHIVDEEEEFYNMFDRAYSLGKQEKDGIDLKKLNEMFDDTLKKETKESLNQWLSKKDADTVTINKGEYYKLCKCSRYMANWVPYFDVCPICGEYNQRGCICANCYNDKKTKNNNLNSNE